MGEEKIENKIVSFLKENRGIKYSIKDLSRKIDEVDNYTWVIRKCEMLKDDLKIELQEGMVISSQGTRMFTKQVWVE